MATATEYAGASFARSPSISSVRSPEAASPLGARSPDLISPNFPNRAIRPLPKSKLRSRLSPEQRSSIVYPPDPPPISPTLSFTVQEIGTPNQQRRLTNGDSQHHQHDHDVVHHHCTCGEDGDSGDDEVEFDHPDYRYPPAAANGTAVKLVDSLQRRLIEASRTSSKPPPPGSTASSADGYESFENTSNKKKRKIPLSGTSSMHQSQLSAELANMGIGSSTDGVAEEHGVNGAAEGEHYPAHAANGGSTGSGTGISGAGRGRFGRQEGKVRRPVTNGVSNGVNGYTSRAPTRASDARHGSDPGPENTGGIISQAIKTAAEQGPLTPAGNGRDNTSLLQSATSANTSATPKTQFTFTCESDSANKMVDQHPAAYPSGTPAPARNIPSPGKSTHGTQTTPTLPGRQQPANVGRPPPPPSNAPLPGHHQQQAPPPKPKPRRNPAKEYALQAANRKKQQQYQNFHHRPKREDMWICEFCEYEDIYGVPPYAMIRKYEIKDRQERKKAAEKKRLLEKAKMKGRKNKKGAGKGKNNNGNNAAAPAAPAHPQNYDPNLPPPDGEEYYDDEEYDGDDYDPVGDEQYDQGDYPPPAPAGTPAMPAAGVGGRASSV